MFPRFYKGRRYQLTEMMMTFGDIPRRWFGMVLLGSGCVIVLYGPACWGDGQNDQGVRSTITYVVLQSY